MDFAAILGDNSIPDTVEFELNGQKVTLGAVRDLSKRQQKQLSDEMERLTRERNEVKELATKAAELIANTQRTQTQAEPVVPNDDWNDPWYKPVKDHFTPLEKQVQEAMTKLNAQEQALQKAAMIFAKRMFREDYRDVRDRLKSDKYKEYRDPEKLAEYAAKHNLVDDMGFPSVTRAVDDLTREDALETERKKAYEEGLSKGRIEGRMGTMPRPSSATGGAKSAPSKGLDPTKNFEDLGDSVSEDPELMQMLSQIGALDVQ